MKTEAASRPSEAPTPTADVLVAGAGPAGLAAAILVATLGYDTALVAPAAAGADRRTSALLDGSVALLTRIGVWPDLAELAAPMRTLRIVDGTRRLIRAPEVAFHAGEIGLDAFGYNIPNAVLVAALEAKATVLGIRRILAAVEGLREAGAAMEVALDTGRRIAARLVVGADGRRSQVRTGLGIDAREWRYAQSALVADLRHSRPHEDTSTEFHAEGGPFTLVPLPGLRSSLVWVDRPEETARRMALSDAELAAEIEERSASILGAFALDGPRQAFPLSGMTAARFAGSRAVLVGEAAHVFPPIGAQGLNLGYRDVAALGDILAGPLPDPGAAAVTEAYQRRRSMDVLARTAAVDALNRSLLSDFLPVQGIRGVGLFLLDRVPALREAAMRLGVASGANLTSDTRLHQTRDQMSESDH